MVVTGAASGLGLASARRFASEGARVVLVDRDPDRLAEAHRLIGDGASAQVCDVTDEGAVAELVATVAEDLGGIDCYFNNAGIAHPVTRLEDLSLATWERTMAVNATAIFLAARAVAPVMRQQAEGGVLLITSSISGRRPRPGLTAYTASKGAAIVLTSALAIELAPKIRVNGIAPLAVSTPMLPQFGFAGDEEDAAMVEQRLAAAVPLQRLTTPADVAAAATYLASDEASGITGVTLNVDSGRNL